jgi:hypothetical protein
MTDKDNKQGLGGGPKTEAGKAISSQNAMTHGVTSTKITTAEESLHYKELLIEFQSAYPSKHPLVKLQIERLVMTRLQLKRVQDLIHAQNLKSQYSSVVEQQLAEELKLDEQTRDLEFYQRMDVLTLDFKYVGQILGEIIRVTDQNIDDVELYWELMPNFFKHLDYEATNRNTSAGKYMDRLIKRKRNKAGIEVVVITREEANAIQAKVIEPSLKDEVSKLTIEDVRDLIQVVQRDLMKAVESETKIKEFREILPIMQQANLPNLEVLDKLMRYQTSLNNQLSKQMGELMELENKYGNKG